LKTFTFIDPKFLQVKKILLIEDAPDLASAMAEVLKLERYEVLTAWDGRTGIEKTHNEHPDLIVCDLAAPEPSGYAVLEMLQQDITTSSIPFVLLTTSNERQDYRKAMELGADDYLVKPFEATELLKTIESRLIKCDNRHQRPSVTEQKYRSCFLTDTIPPWNKLFENCHCVHPYHKKQVIYAEGNYPTCMYYILKGKVKSFKVSESGRELVTGLFDQGDFFGYAPLLEGCVYPDSAATLEETTLAVISGEQFDNMVLNDGQGMMYFLKMIAGNISEKEKLLLGLAYDPLRKKIARALLLLQEKFGRNDPLASIVKMNREGLASVAGTAKESMIRTLAAFKHEKLIEIAEDGSIRITDPGGLARV
jgi:CheY-like chemotaxis protein